MDLWSIFRQLEKHDTSEGFLSVSNWSLFLLFLNCFDALWLYDTWMKFKHHEQIFAARFAAVWTCDVAPSACFTFLWTVRRQYCKILLFRTRIGVQLN